MVLLLGAGCVSRQLEQTTLRTLDTLPDLTYQQVINNLAAVAAVPGRLPSLAVVGEGSVQVTGNGSATLGLIATRLVPGFTGSINTTGVLSLGTVTDPTKLREMQAVYQHAVAARVQGLPSHQWIRWGHYRTVPSTAAHVGRRGDLAVWVMPEDVGGLTELTLEILDIATREDSPALPHHTGRRNFQAPPRGAVFTPGG
jgi:hypothetical protein